VRTENRSCRRLSEVVNLPRLPVFLGARKQVALGAWNPDSRAGLHGAVQALPLVAVMMRHHDIGDARYP
jgi:hypothetical protein